MRRTTICRSEAVRLAAVVALVCAASPLAAQQPTVIQRPIQQAQRAAQQAGRQTAAQQQPAQQQPTQQQPAQQPTAAQLTPTQGRPLGPVPATHTVAQGETLWGLAQQFLGDPLLWPEIYRLNTTVVEDPHWIFPGEELRLVAGEEQAAAAAPGQVQAPADSAQPGNVEVTPPPEAAPAQAARVRSVPGADQPTIFSEQAAVRARQNTLQAQEMQAYRAVRAGEYYSAAFLADPATLQAGVLGENVEQNASQRLANRETAALYSTVTVTPPGGQTYHRGDELLAYRVGRAVTGYGNVIEPLGMLLVTADGEAGQAVTAQVRGVYGSLGLGAKLLKVEPFHYDSSARPVPVDSGLAGTVIATRRNGELTNVQDEFFIDRGADDGVHLGDVFHISTARGTSGGLVRDQADALVVKLQPKTSTAIVLQVSQPDIRPGATARVVRRMPS